MATVTKTRTAVFSPELKRLRAISMLRERVRGMTTTEIAESHRVSQKTVERTLTYARRAGIIVEESDKILEEMVPLARGVLIQALREGDVTVALKVYEGTGLLGNKGKPSGANSDDNELLKHMEALRQRAQELADTSEGELLDAPERLQLPPQSESAGSRAAGTLIALAAEGEATADEAGVLPTSRPAAQAAPKAGTTAGEDLDAEPSFSGK